MSAIGQKKAPDGSGTSLPSQAVPEYPHSNARDGLAGAQASLRDAQDAVDYALRIPGATGPWAEERRVWRFEGARLDVLTRDVPDRRLSFVRTAEVVHLHPNPFAVASSGGGN